MTSEERIDELEKRVRIMELKNDNLGKRLDIMSEQLQIVNNSLVQIYEPSFQVHQFFLLMS